MEDLRKQLTSLEKTANNHKEQRARIKGKIDILTKSLKDFGVSMTNATNEVQRLKKIIEADNKKLTELVKDIQDKYADKL